MTTAMMDFQDIVDDFSFIESWEDKYRYIIELGRKLPPLDQSLYTDENKVRGCASQVWLVETMRDGIMEISGDSDAHIVKGLITLIIILYAGKTPEEIISLDASAALARLSLTEHLTPQRANGVASVINRIKALADRHHASALAGNAG